MKLNRGWANASYEARRYEGDTESVGKKEAGDTIQVLW